MSKSLDRLNSFVVEFKTNLSAFDIGQFKDNYNYLKEGVGQLFSPTDVINPRLYCDYITKTIDNLVGVTNNIDEMEAFFSKVYKSASLAGKGITIPLQPDEEIDKIRPEYLTSVSNDFKLVIKKILSGEVKNPDIKKNYVSGDYFEKIKKQLVKTTITVNDVRDLMKMESPTMVKVDNMYLQNNIIPFIRSYNQNVKDLTVISVNLKGRINDTYTEILDTMEAVNRMQSEGKLDDATIRTINYYKYNLIRGYMNLCAYISGMLIRKVSCYTYNMMSYVNLYNMIYNYFPEGELVLHESVIDGDLTDIDDSTLVQSILNNDLSVIIPHIQNAIGKKKMEIANMISKKYNKVLYFDQNISSEKFPYDVYPYTSVNKTIAEIAKSLGTFEKLANSSDFIVDDVIENSGLEETFTSKYEDILSKITSIDYYISQSSLNVDVDGEDVTMSLYNDISHFEKNMTIISKNIYKVYKYLEAMIDKYAANSNNMDNATFNEVNSFIKQLMKNYKEYVLLLTKRLLERLDNLTDALDDTSVYNEEEPEEYVPYDYDFSSYTEACDEIEILEKKIFESMYRDYYTLRNKLDRGVKIVYEDVTEANQNSTTPTVKTDAEAQHNKPSENTENKTNTTQQSGDNKPKENLVEKFTNWIKGVLDKFKSKSKTMSDKNNKWLASVKSDILALNTENTSITLAKYENVTTEKISGDITAAITKINGISPSNLPNELKGSKSKAELYIFNSIPEKINGADGFSARIKQFFTHGKTDKTSLVTYSGADAKTQISNMISFCEDYPNMYSKISSELDKLSKAAADKQSAIVSTLNSSGGNVNESVLLEANQNEVNQDGKSVAGSEGSKDKINASTVITGVVRDYSGAILTVVEKKYLDYIKVLDKLAPKNKNEEPAKDNSNNDEEQNSEENQNK